MPNLTCEESYLSLLQLINPTAAADFRNPNYNPAAWEAWDQGPYKLNFYYDGVPYDFGKWYVPETMIIRKLFGFEPGDASFEIWDYGIDSGNLPFWIPGQMECHIQNRSGDDTFFVGRVQDIRPTHINRRPDGTENRRLKITLLDLKTDFKRWLYSDTYTNTTTYGVMKDAIANHSPFDASEIDASKGLLLKSYKVNQQDAATVIQEMLDLEITTTFYLDPVTRKVYLGEITDPVFNFLTVTESNVYDYFNIRDFFISRQTQILRNRVIFWFNGAYANGTVAVTQNGTTVIGTGTSWMSNIKKGSDFTVQNDTQQYNVVDVLSNTDIKVSPAIVRTTASSLSYSVTSYRDCIIVDDAENIATMAAVLNEDFAEAGVFMVKMPERPNPLSRDQARILAQAYVNRMTSSLILRGQAVSENTKVKTAGLEPGWTITYNLPVSRKLQTTVIVQGITLEDISGGHLIRSDDPSKIWHTDASDTRIDPHHRITFDFTDRRLMQEQVIERTLQDIRDVQVTDDTIVEAVASCRELMFVGDCAGIVTNIGPNDKDSPAERVTVEDLAQAEIVTPGGAYYAAPVSGGQTAGYCLDSSHFSFAS